MLKEKSFYKEGLPVNVITADIRDYPIHFHDDMEVVYVLEGTVKLKNGHYTYTLKEGDIFILNDREIHSFYHNDEPNMVMMLQMDLSYFSKFYGNLQNSFFVTGMDDDDDESLEALRGVLAQIMLEILMKGYGYEYKVIEGVHNLLANLMANFRYFSMEDGKFVNEAKNMGNKVLAGRLNRITNYMYDNYTRRLTLNEIAEMEHLSIYYLSHVIKEATGLSFQELLSFIRVEESEKLLLGTNKKIGVIAEESGFSAIRYYIKYFIKWFGMHPLEYREKYTGRVSSREISATCILSKPEDILRAIKHQCKNVYTIYERTKGPAWTHVTLSLEECGKEKKDSKIPIKELFEHRTMSPASFAFHMLMALNEQVIEYGNNYMITRILRGTKNGEHLSILIYNSNEMIHQFAQQEKTLQGMAEKLTLLEDRTEVLLTINGAAGTYRISRYKFSKENILMSYKVKQEDAESLSKRERLTSRWATTPAVEFSTVTTVDSLSVQSNLQGFSAELILIDQDMPKEIEC